MKPHLNKNNNGINNAIRFFKNNNVYHLHNSYHLGDNIFNCIIFYNIKSYIETNNIKIFYYAPKKFLNQINEFMCSPNITLLSLTEKPNNSIELWVNDGFFNYKHCDQKQPVIFNEYLKRFYNKVLDNLSIPVIINRFFYVDDDLLVRLDSLPNKYKMFDILILNSQPFSKQYNYDKEEWDKHILQLHKTFKILTTSKVTNLLCTADEELTVKDIAALSTKAKVVIAVNSGVVPGLLNYYTLTSVKHFFIFDKICIYSYPNFENKIKITEITIYELNKYIE